MSRDPVVVKDKGGTEPESFVIALASGWITAGSSAYLCTVSYRIRFLMMRYLSLMKCISVNRRAGIVVAQ